MDRQHPLIAFASRWHACTGDVPPPLVGASITFVEVPQPSAEGAPPPTAEKAAADRDAPGGPEQGEPGRKSAAHARAPTRTPPKSRLYVFGGRLVSTRRMISDLWYLDLDTLVWTKVAPHPPNVRAGQQQGKSTPSPRYFHSADVWNGRLIVFGGMGYQAAGTARSEQLVADSISAADNGGSGGSGAASKGAGAAVSHHDDLCVLDDILAFDLVNNKWDFDFVPSARTARSNDQRPMARYAHLSAITSEFLIVLGGQNAANAYIERIDIFHLPSRRWVAHQMLEKQCGSYRSLVASPQLIVSQGAKAPIENATTALKMASLTSGSSTMQPSYTNIGRQPSEYTTSPSVFSSEGAPFDRNGDRDRSDSTASRPSLLSVNSGFSTSTDGGPGRSGATASSLSGLVGNPAQASTANLSLLSHAASSTVGSSHLESEDGMFGVEGGSGAERNNYVQELERPALHTFPLPMSSSAALNASATNAKATSSGDDTMADRPAGSSGLQVPPLYLYSNYHFTDVKREIEVVSVDARSRNASANAGADQGSLDVSLRFQEISSSMRGAMLPPGLRFPTGSVVGEHLIVSGTYLANTSQSFSIWSLHLPTLVWTRIDIGNILGTGSWNRAVVWPGKESEFSGGGGARSRGGRTGGSSHEQEASSGSGSSGPRDAASAGEAHDEPAIVRAPFSGNKLIILGHRGRDLVNDYNHRQVNCDHVIIVDLESWGIYQPPATPFFASDAVLAGRGHAALAAKARPSPISHAMSVELGLAKLRSSAQGGLVPVPFLGSSLDSSENAAPSAPGTSQGVKSLFGPSVTRLRSDSSVTASSAGSGSSRGRRIPSPSAQGSLTGDAAGAEEAKEKLAMSDAEQEADDQGTPSQAVQARGPAPLPFAPLSFGGRGDFEIICSDGLWIGCDRVVLERRWPWFADRMKEYRKRAKRFAASPLGVQQQGTFAGQASGAEDAARKGAEAVSKDRGANAFSAADEPSGSDAGPSGDAAGVKPKDASNSQAGTEGGAVVANGTVASASSATEGPSQDPVAGTTLPTFRRSPDPRTIPRQLVFPEPSPVVLAFLEYLYTRTVCTALQRHPVILASLLVIGTTYQLHDLVQWCVHAAHVVIGTDLSSPSSEARYLSRNATPTSSSLPAFANSAASTQVGDNALYAGSALSTFDPVRNDLSIEQRHRYAVLLFEAATLCGSEALQIRALRTVMGLNKYEVGRQHLEQRKKIGGAGSPSHLHGADARDSHDGEQQSGRPEYGRHRASTTTSGLPSQKPGALAMVSAVSQAPYQHLIAEARGSLDEGSDGSYSPAPHGASGRGGGLGAGGGPAVVPSTGPTRPRATTGPSKNDALAGRTSLSASGSQYRNGPGLGAGQTQSQLQAGGPPSAASAALAASSAAAATTSRISSGKKRFSLFGRSMGSTSTTSSGGPGVLQSSSSPGPSPSTSNVDISNLGMAAGYADAQEHYSSGGEVAGLPRQSEEAYRQLVGGGGAQQQQQQQQQAQPPPPPPQAILTRVGQVSGSSGASTPSPSTESPVSGPRTSSQARGARALSSAVRAPRASGGPPPAASAAAGVGGGLGSGGAALPPPHEEGKTSTDLPHAPSSGLVARRVREREASGGAGH